jgi:hypothetical protein
MRRRRGNLRRIGKAADGQICMPVEEKRMKKVEDKREPDRFAEQIYYSSQGYLAEVRERIMRLLA